MNQPTREPAGELPAVGEHETPDQDKVDDVRSIGELQHNLHELKQPLNLIRLTAANIRSRILPALDEADAAYLAAKLDRIETQVERAVDIGERFLTLRQDKD